MGIVGKGVAVMGGAFGAVTLLFLVADGDPVIVLGSRLLVAATCVLLLWSSVAVPLRRLAERVRGIGTSPPPLPEARDRRGRRDEIGELSRELEALGDRHETNQQRLVAETTSHRADLERLDHANRLALVGRLAASGLHELGAPLAVIQARAQMIAAGEVPPLELRAEAEAILQQTQRITSLARDLLDVARQGSAPELPVDLTTLGRRTVAMLLPLAREQGVTLELLDPAPVAMVLGDRVKLRQILINLTMNAIQAMPRGGAVTFRVERRRARGEGGIEGEYCALEVCDTGEGIAPELLPRIFDTFFTTKKEGEGTGLGLSVSSRLAREHRGWIGVESQLGVGSRFTLYLPRLGEA